MQKREKILALMAAAVVLLFLGGPEIKSLLIGPIQERHDQLNILDQQLSTATEKAARVTQAAQTWKDWQARSLPGDPLNAQRLYQVWLTDLAQEVGFSELEVTPGRRASRSGVYTVVQVAVEGKATIEQLARFLFEFDRANLAHRIATLTMETAQHRGNPPLDVTLSAEGLSLNGVADREELFPSEDGDSRVRPEYRDRAFDEDLAVVQHSPFVKPSESTPTASPPASDPARETYLVASVTEADQRRAWLYRRSAGQRTIIRKGTNLSIGDIQAVVLDVTPDFVLLQQGEETWRLRLGENLRSMEKVESTESSLSAEPAPDSG